MGATVVDREDHEIHGMTVPDFLDINEWFADIVVTNLSELT